MLVERRGIALDVSWSAISVPAAAATCGRGRPLGADPGPRSFSTWAAWTPIISGGSDRRVRAPASIGGAGPGGRRCGPPRDCSCHLVEGLGCRFGRSAVSFEHAERARRVGQRLGKRESGGACADYAYVAFKTAPASRGDRVNDAHVLPRPQSRSRSPCPRMGCRSFSSTLATRQPPE